MAFHERADRSMNEVDDGRGSVDDSQPRDDDREPPNRLRRRLHVRGDSGLPSMPNFLQVVVDSDYDVTILDQVIVLSDELGLGKLLQLRPFASPTHMARAVCAVYPFSASLWPDGLDILRKSENHNRIGNSEDRSGGEPVHISRNVFVPIDCYLWPIRPASNHAISNSSESTNSWEYGVMIGRPYALMNAHGVVGRIGTGPSHPPLQAAFSRCRNGPSASRRECTLNLAAKSRPVRRIGWSVGESPNQPRAGRGRRSQICSLPSNRSVQ